MAAVWAIPTSQLAWATRHVDKNHDNDFTDSFAYYAIINIKKGTAAREQFRLVGGRECYHLNFRSVLTFAPVFLLLLESPNLCARKLY